MFFSSNTKNGHDPFCNLPHLDHSFHLPISFFPFPSPFDLDDHHNDLNMNFTSSNSSNSQSNNPSVIDQIMLLPNSDDHEKKIIKMAPTRKRLCKKDRHSKITTARGVRDRRMRLSLPVARQFFGLQDMLGLDKGSKTVEWLLIQAKPQILKLATETNHSSSYNSTMTTTTTTTTATTTITTNDNNIKIKMKKKMKKKKIMRSSAKHHQPIITKTMAKELRGKARERARARTLEKKNIIIQNQNQIMNNNNNISRDYNYYSANCCSSEDHNLNLNKIISSSSWSSPFEGTNNGEEDHYSAATQSYNDHHHNNPINSQFDYQNSSSNFDIIFPNWSPSEDSTFNFLHQQHEFEESGIFGS